MSSNIHGTGRKRRDDVYNRVKDLFLKGQIYPMASFYNGTMADLLGAPARDFINVQTTHSVSDLNLIVCGKSKCGGPDVCG